MARRGYWGDIVNSPFVSIGTESDNKELFKKANGKHVKVRQPKAHIVSLDYQVCCHTNPQFHFFLLPPPSPSPTCCPSSRPASTLQSTTSCSGCSSPSPAPSLRGSSHRRQQTAREPSLSRWKRRRGRWKGAVVTAVVHRTVAELLLVILTETDHSSQVCISVCCVKECYGQYAVRSSCVCFLSVELRWIPCVTLCYLCQSDNTQDRAG